MPNILNSLNKRSKILIISAVILFAIAVPLTIIQVQKQQETRQRAAEGKQISLYFAEQGNCNSRLTNLGGFATNVSLCLDAANFTAGISGFNIVLSTSDNLTFQSATAGTDSNNFSISNPQITNLKTLEFRGINIDNNVISTLPLLLLNFSVTANGNGQIDISNNEITSLGTNTLLTVATPSPPLSYSVTAAAGTPSPAAPTATPAPASCTRWTDCPVKECKVASCANGACGYVLAAGCDEPTQVPSAPTPTSRPAVQATPTSVPPTATPGTGNGAPAPISCASIVFNSMPGQCANSQSSCPQNYQRYGSTNAEISGTDCTTSISPNSVCCYYSPSVAPTSQPTPTIPPGNTVLAISLNLEGIGTGANANPRTPARPTSIDILNASNQMAMTKQTTLNYDSSTALFKGTVDLGSSFTSGNYLIKIKSDRYLKRLLPGIITITSGQTVTVPTLTLFAGDINGDNVLDALDYGIFVSCFGPKATTASCLNKATADVNDDGVVDGVDYNLFLHSLAIRKGD